MTALAIMWLSVMLLVGCALITYGLLRVAAAVDRYASEYSRWVGPGVRSRADAEKGGVR